MTRGTGALWFGLALLWCLQAMAQEPEPRSRQHSDDSADEADSASDGESAHDRRKRRREERAKRKAEEEAAAASGESATTSAADAPSEKKSAKAGKGAKGAPAPAPVAEAPPVTPVAAAVIPEIPPAAYVPRAVDGPPPYAPGEVLEGEGAFDVKRLPSLLASGFDFSAVPKDGLRKLDGRLGLTLEEMQASEPCTALRTASRVPMRSWLTREHQREILVMAGLFVFALFMAFTFRSPAMRAIMPMVPFLACLYVGYDMMSRADARIDSIARGMRACSATLGEGSAEKPQVVREHFERLTRVRDNISTAFDRENGLVARVMDQYRM